MGFTATGAAKALQPFVQSGAWYLAFSTTTPTADGGNFTEPSGGGYARVPLRTQAVSGGYLVTISGHKVSNSETIFMPEPTASWGTLTHFGLFASSTGTTPDFVGELLNSGGTQGVTVNSGYIFFIRAGEFEISIDPVQS